MAFEYQLFQRWSQSDVKSGNTLWGYRGEQDTMATILSAGYFNSVNINPDPILNIGDLMWVKATDSTEFIEVTAITPNVTTALYYPGTGAGADTDLSNLVATAINQSLIADADSLRDLGSALLKWATVHADTGAFTDVTATGAATIGSLGVTSVATSLISDTDSTDDLGSNAVRWSNLYADTATLTNPLAHEYGGLEADVSAYSGYPLISGGTTSNIKMNFAAAVAPAPTDDSSAGYSVGSIWLDTTADLGYICVDSSVAAAVWRALGGGVAEWTSATASGPSQLEFYEDTDFGTNKVTLKGANALASNIVVSLPATLPASDQSIMTITSAGALTAGLSSSSASYVGGDILNDGFYAQNGSVTPQTVGLFSKTGIIAPHRFSYTGYHLCNLGCRGIDTTSAGLTMADDTIYIFPIRLKNSQSGLGTLINRISFGVQTADASGTADVEVCLFSCQSATSGRPAFGRIGTVATESNIAATGIKTVTYSPGVTTTLGNGDYWVALRSDNIGTSLVLAAPTTTNVFAVEELFGQAVADFGAPADCYGYYYSGQTSMPSFLLSTTVSGTITTPTTVYVGAS